jgi:hypothetical protein
MFTELDVISEYSRQQAIADGVLVDVSSTAREAGITFPCALSRAAYEQLVEWTPADNDRKHTVQDEAGRLWDVVYMFRVAARRSSASTIRFSLYAVPREGRGQRPKLATLKAVCGPGDTAEPVITISLPDED